MQQPRLKMSAFSLYGCLSTTSGAMLRNDPVWPAACGMTTAQGNGVMMSLRSAREFAADRNDGTP